MQEQLGVASLSRNLIISIGIVCLTLFCGCGKNVPDAIEEVFVVRIPPQVSSDLSDGEKNCVYEHWLYRRDTALDLSNSLDICRGVPLAKSSNPAVLLVRLDDKDGVTLNGGSVGRLSYLKYTLTVRLAEIFKEREKNKMFEPNSTVLEKTVHIRLEGEGRTYSDLLTIVEAVRQSGARDIVLALEDDLPFVQSEILVNAEASHLTN